MMLGSAGLIYWILTRFGLGLPRHYEPRLYDVDVIYRVLLVTLPTAIQRLWARASEALAIPMGAALRWVAHPKWPIDHLGQSRPIGAMAFWVAIMFAVAMFLGLINA